MKNTILCLIASVAFLISSCNDIVNSEDNIKKTVIEYSYILQNQDNGVILPLKEGNVWYFDVSEFNKKNELISKKIDSIKVLGDTIINKEQWFIVNYPPISDNILMANTDLGLWVKCNHCNQKSFLLAEYPMNKKKFASAENKIDREISKTSQVSKLNTKIGFFDCVEYSAYTDISNDQTNDVKIATEYFSPGFGFVKGEWYFENKMIYEIREKPTDISEDCKYTVKSDLGTVNVNYDIFSPIDLFNQDDEIVSIYESNFFIEQGSDEVNLNIQNSEYPIVINTGGKFSLRMSVKPKKTGVFNYIIKIKFANNCWYEVIISGNAI